jgi:hypothetical protein
MVDLEGQDSLGDRGKDIVYIEELEFLQSFLDNV